MSDIAKCNHEACPRKADCYRYTAPANDRWQAYALFRPGKDGACAGFRPNGRKDK